MITRRIALTVWALTLPLLTSTASPAEPDRTSTTGSASEGLLETAPVEIDGDVLFPVRGTTSRPAEQRARTISANVEAAAADPTIPLDTVRLVGGDKAVDIMAGDLSLMTVYDADGRREDLSAGELAAAHRLRIKQAIAEYRRARTPEALRRGMLWAGIATLIFAIAVLGLWRSARRIDRWASERMASRIGSVGIESFEFVQGEKIHRAFLGAVHLARTLVLAVGLIAYLSFTLAQFPWTRGLSRRIVSIVTAPLTTMGQAILADIPNLVFLAILVYVFRIVLRLLRLFCDAVANGTVKLAGFEQDWAVPTYKIVRFAVVDARSRTRRWSYRTRRS